MTPTLTDWLMVIITAVYVVATCAICFFNFRSAKAAQGQLTEAKRQYEEEKKDKSLPWFHVSIDEFVEMGPKFRLSNEYEDNISNVIFASYKHSEFKPMYRLKFTVRNIGLGAATKFTYTWSFPDRDNSLNEIYSRALLPSESYTKMIFIDFDGAEYIGGVKLLSATIRFAIYDIYNREYAQNIKILFDVRPQTKLIKTVSPIEVESDVPREINSENIKSL